MKWLFWNSGSLSGEKNMALDLAMTERAKYENVILRLYGWNPPALSLGKFQKVDEINLESVKEQGFDIVRRPSGGRAVLHIDELTYAIAIPQSLVSKSVLRSYMEISQALVIGLKKLGLDVYMARERSNERYTDFAACFATTALHEVMIEGKKLIGSAQVRRDGVVLQHGSIPLHSHIEEYVRCFKLSSESAELLKKRLYQKTTSISEYIKVKRNDVVKAILEGFSERFGIDFIPAKGVIDELDWEKYVREVKV
ncbi:lipoate--protein ligase family protein [Mesoaciditoga lauensis]|uniref:lipoate--protein ligase family protein n=1 Tax=Mesoaciditoga lauensis TaxID=1495039 RepID=UPI0006906C66|nr:biotin/lipoate A/B protein ligase family protein [Mesoaciditoga lauensis]